MGKFSDQKTAHIFSKSKVQRIVDLGGDESIEV